VIDITLWIFAVGVAKRAKTIDRRVARGLKLKLENLRKCAMRALIKRNGLATYQEATSRCRRFEAWCRYNVLYFHLPRRNHLPVIKLIWRDQVSALQSAAQRAIAERSHVVVDEKKIDRMAKLALAELRRRRHDTTPMELLRNPQKAEEFMFEFIENRIELRPLKPYWMTLCERQAEVGEKLKAALVIDDEGSGLPETAPTEVSATSAPNYSAPAKAISEEQVQKAVTWWLRTNVNPGYWHDVTEEVTTQIYRIGRLPSKTVVAGSLEEIIEAHRPVLSREYMVMVGQLVDWLLGWTMNLTRNPRLVHDVIKKGFAQAWRESGVDPLTVGVKLDRYVGGV
jgi:hypothetical protein